MARNLRGDGEIRTHDPLLARQVLSQLSYTPIVEAVSATVDPRNLGSPTASTLLLFGRKQAFDRLGTPNLLQTQRLSGSGSHLLSHTVSSIVPSAAYGLTSVFGMRTGISRKRIATRNLRYLLLIT